MIRDVVCVSDQVWPRIVALLLDRLLAIHERLRITPILVSINS